VRLITERLVLTPFDRERDWADFVTDLILDPVVTRYWEDFADPALTDDDKEQMAAAEFLPWFQEDHARGFAAWILRTPEGEFVGLSGLTTADEPVGGPDPEFGCLLATRWHGSGLATEAGRAVIEDGWERLGLGRVITVLESPNPASRRLVDKLGFRFDRVVFNEASQAYVVLVLDRPETMQVAG